MAYTAYFDASIGTKVRLSGLIECRNEIILSFCVDFKDVKSIKLAEHMALKHLLERMKDKNIKGVSIFGDAKDVIREINKISSKRYKTVRRLLTETESVVTYIPRKQNKADKLFR
ncbi:reverse transcriptase-like protein [Paenibacillus chitinolyticus]|uniref:reverse transcriptase-like protein n=1 Tax=Paenibacillus chitinolyticus TaxID=79263 RepID=UPI0035DB21C8